MAVWKNTAASAARHCEGLRGTKQSSPAVLPQACIVIDKFHVVKHLMEALQSVRLQVKREIQTGRKQQKEKQKEKKKIRCYRKKHPAIRTGGQTWNYRKRHAVFLLKMHQELEPEDASLLDLH
jgi:transposase